MNESVLIIVWILVGFCWNFVNICLDLKMFEFLLDSLNLIIILMEFSFNFVPIWMKFC